MLTTRALPSLLLAAATALSACASSPARREVPVDVLWYSNDASKGGGASRAVVSVEPNATDRVRVGVIEESALQLGDLWRASVWLAAFQASLALARPLSDWLVFVELDHRGRGMDGPSAGAVLTTAMLAGMTGAKVDPAFAMTGTINPDGSVGPVSGIPQKFEAAVAAGKRVLGHPLGQDRDIDLRTGQSVLLAGVVRGTGAVVHEVPDLETAYTLMTGRTLVRPPPASAEALRLPAPVEAALRAQAEAWLSGARANFRSFEGLRVSDPWLVEAWKTVTEDFDKAWQALQASDVAGAWARAARLFVDADSALLYAHLLRRVRDGRPAEALSYARGVIQNVDRRLVEVTGLLQPETARSPDDLMTLVEAFEAFGSAIRHFGAGLRARDTNAPRIGELVAALQLPAPPGAAPLARAALESELLRLLHAPARDISLANVNTLVAQQSLGFRPTDARGAKPVPQRTIDRLQGLFRIAANTNLSYFETLVIQTIATNKGASRESVQDSFADNDYQHVRLGPRAMMEATLEEKLGAGTQQLSLVKLAASVETYVGAAFLVAKYYALEAQTDALGRAVSVRRGALLNRLLRLAAQKAAEHAGRARQELGEVPVAARLAYATAVSFEAGGSQSDRLAALAQYWRASTISQLAVLVRR
jgi:uncharacterized protein